MMFRSNCVRPVYAVYGKDEGDRVMVIMGIGEEEFAEGRRMARKDHFWHGRKYVKIKAAGCLEGHGWAYRRGYRDYAIHCCPVRRLIDF